MARVFLPGIGFREPGLRLRAPITQRDANGRAVLAQSLVRSDRMPRAAVWIPTMGIAWAIAWVVTTSIGVQAEAGWPVVGVSGALVAQALTGLVLVKLGGRKRVEPAIA